MFNFAIERGVIESTPVVGIRATRETPRERTLSHDELKLLWVATALGGSRMEPPTRLAIRLLLLTGARTGEVCAARWGEVNVEAADWIIPGERAKNGREHRVPLSEAAMEVIAEAAALRRGEWLLPSPHSEGHLSTSTVLEAVQRVISDDAVAHDIRRTVATGLQRLGVRLEVTEAVLNHTSGSRAGIVGVYQLHDWAREKRAALDAWESFIGRLVAGGDADGNVVRLPAKA
jgi:integrase